MYIFKLYINNIKVYNCQLYGVCAKTKKNQFETNINLIETFV